MDYRIKKFFFGVFSLIVTIGAWLWMTAEEYELETQEQAWVVPERFQPPKPIPYDEDEKEFVVKEPPPTYGWVYPPQPVRKAVGKIKKKIKPKKQ